MNIQQDFKELLELLEKHNVDYMIVGGYAVAFHGFPRFTKDIDIFFSTATENIEQIIEALIEFGFPKTELTSELFLAEGDIITLVNKAVGIFYPIKWAFSKRARKKTTLINNEAPSANSIDFL